MDVRDGDVAIGKLCAECVGLDGDGARAEGDWRMWWVALVISSQCDSECREVAFGFERKTCADVLNEDYVEVQQDSIPVINLVLRLSLNIRFTISIWPKAFIALLSNFACCTSILECRC